MSGNIGRVRLRPAVAAMLLWLFGAFALATPAAAYSAASQPLGLTPDAVILNQGSGCPTSTLPCATVWSPSIRFGQPLPTNCSAIAAPFPYQQCIDTSVSPAILRDFIGAAWYPVAVLDPTNGYFLRGGMDLQPPAALLSSLNPLYFPTYSQLAGARELLALSGAVSDANGSFRDALYIGLTDSDTTVYTNSHTDYAGRFAEFGPNSGGWQNTYKNIVALNAYAKAATVSTPLSSGFSPGVSGINLDAFQFGTGISDNELACHNISAAGGGIGHSISMACVQSILDNSYAAADSTHTAYAFLASNIGTFGGTAAYGASGAAPYLAFIDAGSAKVTQQGIVMPGSVTGYLGTIINYGQYNGNPAGGSWTDWIGNYLGGQYRWVDSGNVIASLSTQGLTVQPATGYDALYAVPASGTGNIAYAGVGAWEDGLNLNSATFGDAAIVLQNTVPGSTIRYDANDYTVMPDSTTYAVVVGGTAGLQVTSSGITVPSCTGCGSSGGGMATSGSNATSVALTNIVASSTGAAGLTGPLLLGVGGVIDGTYASAAQSLLYINTGGTLVLGFGTGTGLPVYTLGPIIDGNLASLGVQCVQVTATGQLTGTGAACGSAGGGMQTTGANSTSAALSNIVANSTSLTTPMVLANSVAINGLYSSSNESLLYINSGGTLVLGFGTGAGLPVYTLGPIIDGNLASSGTQCVEATASGQLVGTGSACGSGGGGMNTNGSNATSAALAAIVGAQTTSTPVTGTMLLANGTAIGGLSSGNVSQSLLYINTGGTLVLGFGTGAGLPVYTLGPIIDGNLASGSLQCVEALTTGQLIGTGSACGSASSGMNTNGSNATAGALAAIVSAQTVSTPVTSTIFLANSVAIGGLFGGGSESLMYLNSGNTLVFGFGTGGGVNTLLFGPLFVGSGATAAVSCPSGITAGSAVFVNGIITNCG